MAEKLTGCPSCGAAVEKRDGPGRPTVYCGEPCRRLAAFQIRTIVRRVDRAELALRELKAGELGDYRHLDTDERRKVIALYRRWLAEDQAKLRALIGAGEPSAKERKED
jgi:hypothetical protein